MLMQICICHDAWIKIEMTDNYIDLFSKLKQYKNDNIANFVYYGETRLTHFQIKMNL